MSLHFLQEEERLLSSDRCRYHSGPLAFSGDIYITDRRIVFIPKSSLDKLAGAKDVFIEILDIALIDVKGFLSKQLYIFTDTGEHRFSGSGAFRIQSKIEKLRNTFSIGNQLSSLEEVQEVIYIQGTMNVKYSKKNTNIEDIPDREINVVMDNLLENIPREELSVQDPSEEKHLQNTNYEVFFTKNQIRCEHSTEKTQSFLYEDIQNIKLRNSSIFIDFDAFLISINHNLTPRIYLLLQSFLDGEIIDTEQFWILDYGNSLLGNKGIGCMTQTQFVFIPEGLASVLPLHFPINETKSIYKTEGANPQVYLQKTKDNLTIALSGKNEAVTQKFFSFIYLHFLSQPELSLLPLEVDFLQRYPRIKVWIYTRFKGKYHPSWLFMSENILEISTPSEHIRFSVGGLSYIFEEKSPTTFSIKSPYPLIEDTYQITCYTKPENVSKIKTFYELLRPFRFINPQKLEETLQNQQINIYSIPKFSEISIFSRNFGDGLVAESTSNKLLFHGSVTRKKKMFFFESNQVTTTTFPRHNKLISIHYHSNNGIFTGLTQYRTKEVIDQETSSEKEEREIRHTSYLPPLVSRINRRNYYRYQLPEINLENNEVTQRIKIEFSSLSIHLKYHIQNISVKGCCLRIKPNGNDVTQYQKQILASDIRLIWGEESCSTKIVWLTIAEQDITSSVILLGLAFQNTDKISQHSFQKLLYNMYSSL